MQKTFICFILFFGCKSNTFSQSYFYNSPYYENAAIWEAGLSAGIMNCFTDLGGRPGPGKSFIKDLAWQQAQPCAGFYTSFLYHYSIGARLEASFGHVAADDNILKGDNSVAIGRYRRNLHFRSSIAELALTTEIHPLAIAAIPDYSHLFSPYLLAGIGVFSFNPKANLNGNWVSLRPLHTEGQGFTEHPGRRPYKLTQLNLPVGIGVKYEISDLLTTRIEIIHRVLFTDYLDDVSNTYIDPGLFYRYMDRATATIAAQLADRRNHNGLPNNAPLPFKPGMRGNPANKDAFFSINCKLGIILNRRRM